MRRNTRPTHGQTHGRTHRRTHACTHMGVHVGGHTGGHFSRRLDGWLRYKGHYQVLTMPTSTHTHPRTTRFLRPMKSGHTLIRFRSGRNRRDRARPSPTTCSFPPAAAHLLSPVAASNRSFRPPAAWPFFRNGPSLWVAGFPAAASCHVSRCACDTWRTRAFSWPVLLKSPELQES